MKALVEIEIPDNWELAEPAVRAPLAGETYLDSTGLAYKASFDHQPSSRWPILRQMWRWPAWLRLRWLAMDWNGEWWAFEDEPYSHDAMGAWRSHGGKSVNMSQQRFDFTPPPCGDWRTSKRKNHNT